MNWTARFAMVDTERITHRLIRNQNYGGAPTCVPGTCAVRYRNKGIKPQTRGAITQSIKDMGVRNPILLYNDPEHGLLLSFGGGRLFACQELGVQCPAIINDYTDEYDDCPEVTLDNFEQYFMDVPGNFCLTPIGLDYHYNLERNRECDADPAGLAWADSSETMAVIREESPWLE